MHKDISPKEKLKRKKKSNTKIIIGFLISITNYQNPNMK
jgi:hypothetical protein